MEGGRRRRLAGINIGCATCGRCRLRVVSVRLGMDFLVQRRGEARPVRAVASNVEKPGIGADRLAE